ncbi:MAG: helix-turn-helix domain-containing protein, partial [Deltaproteobacteria bacterium]|nr:helix-turn-helix domain-containing protein [Deltaproteobacteria bacterium]
MPGARLSLEERERISRGLARGHSYAELGRQLGRPTSTISREVRRNGGFPHYRAAGAQ